MPVINIKIIEGRTTEQKREMTQKVTKAISESIGVPESSVWISIEEMKTENFAQGGVLLSDK